MDALDEILLTPFGLPLSAQVKKTVFNTASRPADEHRLYYPLSELCKSVHELMHEQTNKQ